MPFIGVQPASALLTSADIQDGQITTAKIADTAITTAKITDDAVTGAKIENSPTIANGITLADGDLTFASGHGLSFASTSDTSASGSTTANELLDDYEEGSWTPTLSGGSFTIDAQRGQYTKIGRYVFCNMLLEIGSTFDLTHTTGYLIAGLPFVSSNNSNHPSGNGIVHYFDNARSNHHAVNIRVDYGQSQMYLSGAVSADGATGLSVNTAVLKADTNIYGAFSYYTAT